MKKIFFDSSHFSKKIWKFNFTKTIFRIIEKIKISKKKFFFHFFLQFINFCEFFKIFNLAEIQKKKNH